MSPGLSVYLNLVRFLAAMAVFLGHVSGTRFTGGLLWQLEDYGAEAVVVFFVLSGFVIAHVAETRERAMRPYAVARAARIYSVVVPAVALTLALDAVGRSLRPEFYVAALGFTPGDPFAQAAQALVFWTRAPGLGSNGAFWTIAIEVWYYAAFGVLLFAPPRWRWAGLALVAVLGGARATLMAGLWFLGVATYRASRTVRVRAGWGAALAVVPLVAWAGYEVLAWRGGRPKVALPPWADRDLILQDYLIAVLFALHLLGVAARAGWVWRVLRPAARAVDWLAGATFSLYLYHMPIALCLAAALGGWQTTWPGRATEIFATLAIVFALAEVTERRKRPWQRLFARAIVLRAAAKVR